MADRSGPWRSSAAAADPRHAADRRRTDALQIRKRRREERLRRKRGLPSGTTNTANIANAPISLEAALSQYLNGSNPRDPWTRAQLQLALSSNHHSSSTITNSTSTNANAASTTTTRTTTTSTTAFLQRLLEEDEPRARQLVRFVRDDIVFLQQQQQQQQQSALLSALSLLLELTCAVKSDDKSAAAASYYGRPPLQWADLLVPSSSEDQAVTANNEPGLIPVLLQMLATIQQQQQSQPPPQSAINNTTSVITETICNVLGNLVDDAPQNCLPLLLPHWSTLLFWSSSAIWPASSYCCAALIRNDHTHCGMYFLQPPPLLNSNLDQQLAPLFVLQPQSTNSNDESVVTSKPTEAAWILEGLSRREDQAVHALMNAPGATANNGGNSPAWLASLIHAMDTLNPASAADFFVPALRAVGNVCTACRGQYVPLVLERQPAVVETLGRLLELSSSSAAALSPVVLADAIQAAAALLADAGLPAHPATDLALPPLLPRLVALLLRSPRAPVRREAVVAVRNAVIAPPAGPDEKNDSEVRDGMNTNETLRRMEMESHLLAQLRYFVWTSSNSNTDNSSSSNNNNNEEEDQLHQEQLMQALVDLLKGATSHNDTEAVVPALQILDKLLRNIEASRFLFDSHGGVDLLQDICANCPNEMALESQLAAHLMDDLFDEDSVEYDDEAAVAPQDGGDAFIFGAPAAAAAPMMVFDPQQQQQPNFPNHHQQQQQHLPSWGRGRGRTLPAWMEQSFSK